MEETLEETLKEAREVEDFGQEKVPVSRRFTKMQTADAVLIEDFETVAQPALVIGDMQAIKQMAKLGTSVGIVTFMGWGGFFDPLFHALVAYCGFKNSRRSARLFTRSGGLM
jgi:hypothetical protein